MSVAFNFSTTRPKRVAIVVSNPAVSKEMGWSIGFWWAEVVHPYWEFVQNGYDVERPLDETGGALAVSRSLRARNRGRSVAISGHSA